MNPRHGSQKVALTQYIQEVWTDGQAEACDNYLAARYTLHHDPGDLWHGQTLSLEGFKERVRRCRAPFPDQRFDIQAMIEENETIAVTWFWEATHSGDFPGFPASGKRIVMSGATVYYFEDGRITGHWQITDRLGVFRQLQDRN